MNAIPPVVKNLIIINVLLLLATWAMQSQGIDLVQYLGMHYPGSDKFMMHQIVTHMFMHGGLAHLFFNMFALWMFGRVLESVWGSRRFLIYYFVTGLGAVALHMFVNHLEISSIQNAVEAFRNTPSPELLDQFVNKNLPNAAPRVRDFINAWYDNPTSAAHAAEGLSLMERILQMKMDIPTVGASGAVFGVLLAFGVLFPNTQLMLLFPPIPIKAKYFVIAYGLIELYLGFTRPGSNVAHFAHLGGMLFGYLLIKYWNKTTKHFY
ncbi:MAG TPA: rhomboid family intramembrane serine protease [Mariniphaga anaerophila]|uniref:Rhomboid family intramembrane serine protease n=1 Tax=Mariniphaga anaerophila TaxID=1484053 RepID=A0A831LNK1_9BACT|nr:rhomboid family intramembrane serine protease [Mariniphaga anaerophila]